MIPKSILVVLLTFIYGGICAQSTMSDVEKIYQEGLEIAGKYRGEKDKALKSSYLKSAFEKFSQVKDICNDLDEKGKCECADKLYQIGIDIQVKKLPLDSAIEFFELAGSAYQRCDSINKAKVIGSYANQGRLLRDLYQFRKAKNLFSNFVIRYPYLNDISSSEEKFFAGYFYFTWARLNEKIGDLEEAAQKFRSALYYQNSLKKYDQEVITRYSLGVIFNKLGQPHNTIQILSPNDSILNGKEIGKSEKWIRKRKVLTVITRSNAFLRLGNIEKAEKEYQKLLKVFISSIDSARCYNNLGIISKRRKDYSSALSYLRKATEMSSKEKYSILPLHYDNMGDVYFDMNQLDSALYYYQQATATTVDHSLNDSRMNFSLETLVESNSQTALIAYLTSKAKTLHHIYLRDHEQADLDLSRETYELAIDLIDRLRQEFQDADSKLFLLNEAMDTYEGAISAALTAGDLTRAFQISEKSKSTLLYTAMRGQQAKSYAQIPEDLLEEEYFLNEEIAYLEHQLSARADDTELMTRLTIAKTQLEQVMKKIETAYPEYYRLKYDTQPIGLDFLQESLPEQTYLVEFFTGKDSTYIFVIDKGRIQVERIASREADVQDWVQQLHDNRLEENFYPMGHALYQDLFQSFDLEAGHHLLIVPDGQLNYLPFGALLSHPVTAEQRPSQYDYLIQRHPISYSFSAKLWQWTTQQEKSFAPFQKNLLVFAPDFQKIAPSGLSAEDQGYLYDPFFGGRPTVQAEAALSPLRVLKTGARNLSDELDGNFYPNEEQDALLGRFIDIAKQYRVIHLTTHGSSNKDNNRYSYLAFRPTEDSIDNERLYLADLYRLELNADMVVLAACETNLGELHPGEGNASLAQGFTYAGARSIVATLWQVNETSTSDLIQAFYQYLQEGKDKATALQLAKRDLIANAGDYPTPYYWAAPIVIGDTVPIGFRPMWIPYAMIGGFILLLVLMIGILRRRRA